jgi:hypothetical protein
LWGGLIPLQEAWAQMATTTTAGVEVKNEPDQEAEPVVRATEAEATRGQQWTEDKLTWNNRASLNDGQTTLATRR